MSKGNNILKDISDWNLVKLSDVATIMFSSVDKHIYKEERRVRLCNYMDVYGKDVVASADGLSAGSVTEAEYKKFRLRKGDVFITKDSETPEDIARSCYIEKDLKDVVCGYHIAILRPEQDLMEGKFLKRMFDIPSVQHYFYRLSNGVTRFGLTKPAIENALLTIPGKKEQNRIAAVLEVWDEAIEKLERKIELKEAAKMQLVHWMVSGLIRLARYEKQWKTKVFSDCYSVSSKISGQKKEDYLDVGAYPIVDQSNDLVAGYSNNEDLVISDNLPLIIFGDHTRVVKLVNFPFVISNDGTKVFSAEKGFSARFLYYLLSDLRVPNTGYNRHFKYIKDVQFKIPEIDEQQAIAVVLSAAATEIELLKRKISRFKDQKEYLLNNLVTGKIRTPENLKVKKL